VHEYRNLQKKPAGPTLADGLIEMHTKLRINTQYCNIKATEHTGAVAGPTISLPGASEVFDKQLMRRQR